MIVWHTAADPVLALVAVLARASLYGGLLLAAIYALDRLLRGTAPSLRCWAWRIGCARLLLLLAPIGIGLPLLAPPDAGQPEAGPATTISADDESLAGPRASPAAPTSAEALPPGRAAGTWGLAAARLIAGLWLAGVALALGQIVRLARASRRLRAAAQPLEEIEVLNAYRQIAQRLGVAPLPSLLVTRSASGPLTLGSRRPAVILPAALVGKLQPAELQLLLGHELAHVARRNLAWNWLAAAVQCLFFFHPLVWLAARRWAQAQESACDELAVLGTRQPAVVLGNLLVNLSAQQRTSQAWSPALGVSAAYGNLRERIVTMRRFSFHSATAASLRPRNRRARQGRTAVLALVLILVLAPWQLVSAQPKQAPSQNSPGQSAGQVQSGSSFSAAGAGGSSSGGATASGSAQAQSGGSASGNAQAQSSGGGTSKAFSSSKTSDTADPLRQNGSQNRPAAGKAGGRRVSTYSDDDRTIVIREYPNGRIVVEVTQLVGDEEQTQKYSARSEKELAEKHQEAFELLNKYARDRGPAESAPTGLPLAPAVPGAPDPFQPGAGKLPPGANPAKEMLRQQIQKMPRRAGQPRDQAAAGRNAAAAGCQINGRA